MCITARERGYNHGIAENQAWEKTCRTGKKDFIYAVVARQK